jgi:P27 family predicted phage terminase small subunit
MPNPRKSSAIRIAEGNRGHRPIPREIEMTGRPEPPAHLTPAELQRWHEIVASLPDGHLKAADTSTLERMAVAWSTFREATILINQSRLLTRGQHGEPTRNPLLIVQKQAAEQMNLCGMSLGLSPLARTRLTAPDQETADPLTILLGGPMTIKPSRTN